MGEGLGKLRGEDAKKGERMRGEEGVSGKSSADNFERSLNRETILGSIPKTNQEKKKALYGSDFERPCPLEFLWWWSFHIYRSDALLRPKNKMLTLWKHKTILPSAQAQSSVMQIPSLIEPCRRPRTHAHRCPAWVL